MSENTGGNDPEINDHNNNTTTPIQSHQSEDAQSNVSSDDFICSTATTTVNHNDYLGDPLLPTPSHIRMYDHHMTGSQQMIHPSMATEEEAATTTTASEENHFSFVTPPPSPFSPSTLPSLPPSLSPSIASETTTTTVTQTEESSPSSLFYYVQNYFAHDDQYQQQQLQHQFQQYESLPSFHSLASSSSSLIDDTDDYNQEEQQHQQSPLLFQQTIMNDPLQESIQEQQPEQVFPINDTIDQETNSHNKNDSNNDCIQNEMTNVVNDSNYNNISNSESAVSTEHVHDGSEQSSSANNQISLNNDDLVTRSLNENASASSSEKDSESIPNQSSIESDTVFVQSNSDNNDTLNDKNALSNVLKFINETYQFIPMNNQPTVSTEVLPLSSVIVPNESPMYTITTFESVDHMLSSQMNNENQKKKRKKCKPKSTTNATATTTTSSSQPAALSSSSSTPDSALVASSVDTVMTSTAIPAHVANATVATTVPVSASPNNKTPQRNLKRKLLLSDDSMKTKEKRTTETHVCVVCKSVVSYIKGATDKLLGEYKEVFPDFDMTCGKVCDKCYRRCLQHRKMKDPNAMKPRRKRLSDVAPVVETTGIPEKPPQDSDEPVQIDTPSEVLAQLPAPQSEPIEMVTNFDSRVLNIMDNMIDRNAINEMGCVKEAALDTEVMIETPTMLNVTPSLDTTATTNNVENITIADITSAEYISNATNTHDINDNIPTIGLNIVENTNDTSATTILNVENVIDHAIESTIENTDVGVINTIDVVEKPLEADALPTEEIPPVTIETLHQNNIFSEELGLMATETGFDDSTPMRPYQKRSARKSTIPMEIQLLLQQQEEQKLIDMQNAEREKNNQSKEKQTPPRSKRRARASTKKKTTVSLDDIDFDFDETPVKKRKTPKRQKPNPPKNERPRREKTKTPEKQQEKKTDLSIDLGLENIQTENEVVDSEGFIRVRDNHEFFRKCSLRYSSTIQAKLDNRTRSVLNKWLSTKAGACDIQHANTIEAIKSGEMLKCALYMMKNNPLRVTVKATENIADGECIGIYTGALRTADGFAKRDTLALDNIWAFDIPEDALPDYPGKALVVEAVEGGNISRFVQDATWHNSQGNNIKAVPIYHRDYAPGVFVAFVAEYDIFAGEEILMDWGSSCREQIQLQQLDGQCSLSFYSHFYCLALQQAVNQYVPLEYRSGKEKPREVDVDELQYDMFKGKYVQNSQIDHGAILEHINKTNIKRKRGNYEDSEEELHGPPRKVPKTLPALSVRDGMPKVDADFAFDYRRCKILRQVLVDLEPSTLRDLNETDHTPLLHDVLNDFFPPNSSIPSRILKGFVPKAKVVEVISIGHPVRWYAPPNDRAFALAASEPIRKGEPIGLYIGRLSEEVSDEKEFDSYAFSVVVDDIKLVMENFRAGNECRFINDKFRREEDDHSINATAHLTWLLVAKNWIPTILFKATKSIAVDDEIVTDYGDTFWKKICRNSSYEHQEFNAKAQSKIEYLEGLLKQHQAPLPKWPKTLPAKFKGGIDYDDHLEQDIEIVLIDEDDEDEVMEVTTADYPPVVALDELFVNPPPQCDIGLPAESDDDESPILLMDSFELE